MINKLKYIIKEEIRKQLDEISKPDDNTLEKISLEVRNKYPNINKGLCFNFANIIYNLFGFDNFVFLYDKGEAFIGEPLHIAFKLGDNKYYDGYGILTKQQLQYEWQGPEGLPDLYSGDIEDLKEYVKILPEIDKEIKKIIQNVVIRK